LVMSWPFGIFSPVWVFSIASFEFLHILRPFGIFYGLLVISIHTSPCFGSFNKEKSGNPGALFLGPEVVSSSRAPLFSQQETRMRRFSTDFFCRPRISGKEYLASNVRRKIVLFPKKISFLFIKLFFVLFSLKRTGRLLSYFTLSYFTLSYFTLSYFTLSDFTLSDFTLSYCTLS
jgi:hypothetical protein